jgi:DNA-binding MarR family transcriptional regulator
MAMKDKPETIARELLDVIPMTMRSIRKEMRSRRGADLSVPEFRAMLFLQRAPGAAVYQAAEHLGLTPPTVSKMIDGLVERGLAQRVSAIEDRRRVELRLTAKGDSLVDKVRQETAAQFAERLAALPSPDRENLYAALQSLRRVFRAEAGDAKD